MCRAECGSLWFLRSHRRGVAKVLGVSRAMVFSGTVVEALSRRFLDFMRFRNPVEPPPQPEAADRVRVLFLCLGNACRSQMAEAFAKGLYADIIEAESAGISPLGYVPEETVATMSEKQIEMQGHSSKGLNAFDVRSFDIIVNMSGFPFPPSIQKAVTILEWDVDDPFTGSDRKYRKVRDDIEKRVKELAMELRRQVASV